MRPLILTTLLSLAGLLPAAAAQPAQPVTAIESLDLSRYAGQWHEIAHLPVSFQRRCAAHITAHYSLRSDGSIGVRNACRTADGELAAIEGMARQVEDHPARLQVRFAPSWLGWLPMVWADYWVLELDPDYQWAVVGEPGRRYLWILSREPSMDAALFARLKHRAEAMGYDLSALVVAAPLHGQADAGSGDGHPGADPEPDASGSDGDRDENADAGPGATGLPADGEPGTP